MAGEVAIITGAGGGIGRAIAVELAGQGYRLALVGRTGSTLTEIAGRIEESLTIIADVSRPESSEAIVARTVERFGRIDAVINNAGVAPVLEIEQTPPERWREVIDTNLSAAFYLCRAVWPVFRKQGGGVVVNISSMAAKDPFPGFLAYGAAKAGLNNLGISLAREGEPIGVRVYSVAPGAVETPMLRGILSKDQLPEAQTLSPSEVARVVAECVVGTTRQRSGETIWLSR